MAPARGCTASRDRRGATLAVHDGGGALDGELRHDIDLASALGAIGCTFYLHTSLCSTEQGSDACARIESQLELVPVTGASFPAVPRDRFVGDPIESVIYRAVALR